MAEANNDFNDRTGEVPAVKPDASARSKATALPTRPRRDEALFERVFRRAFESVGAMVDKGLGREAEDGGSQATHSLSVSQLTKRMKRAIDEGVRTDSQHGRIAPHLMRLKIEWGTHTDAPREAISELEHELLAAAIDHINDNRLRTLAPVRVETVPDIFTTGIIVEPSFGEFEDELNRRRTEGLASKQKGFQAEPTKVEEKPVDTIVQARLTINHETRESTLAFQPGGRRLNIGRARDNDLCLEHPSVSKVHAAIRMNADGTLIVADTGSTNGTFINGRRLSYGEARTIEPGDVVSFGETEARFKKG